MKKLLLCLAIMVLPLIAVGCMKEEKGGVTVPSEAPGQDALISANSYEFTATANSHTEFIDEINLAGVEAGWQTVTVWFGDDVNNEWRLLPYSLEDGSTVDIDYQFIVGDGYVEVCKLDNGVVNDPPTGGYSDYMVIVHTFAH